VTTSSGTSPAGAGVRRKTTDDATQTSAMSALSTCRPENSSGLLPRVPRSFPKAMTEPVNVIAPMKTPTTISAPCTASDASALGSR